MVKSSDECSTCSHRMHGDICEFCYIVKALDIIEVQRFLDERKKTVIGDAYLAKIRRDSLSAISDLMSAKLKLDMKAGLN